MPDDPAPQVSAERDRLKEDNETLDEERRLHFQAWEKAQAQLSALLDAVERHELEPDGERRDNDRDLYAAAEKIKRGET